MVPASRPAFVAPNEPVVFVSPFIDNGHMVDFRLVHEVRARGLRLHRKVGELLNFLSVNRQMDFGLRCPYVGTNRNLLPSFQPVDLCILNTANIVFPLAASVLIMQMKLLLELLIFLSKFVDYLLVDAQLVVVFEFSDGFVVVLNFVDDSRTSVAGIG